MLQNACSSRSHPGGRLSHVQARALAETLARAPLRWQPSQRNTVLSSLFSSGAYRDRTGDLRLAKPALSQTELTPRTCMVEPNAEFCPLPTLFESPFFVPFSPRSRDAAGHPLHATRPAHLSTVSTPEQQGLDLRPKEYRAVGPCYRRSERPASCRACQGRMWAPRPAVDALWPPVAFLAGRGGAVRPVRRRYPRLR
jgi:hypothetical protein